MPTLGAPKAHAAPGSLNACNVLLVCNTLQTVHASHSTLVFRSVHADSHFLSSCTSIICNTVHATTHSLAHAALDTRWAPRHATQTVFCTKSPHLVEQHEVVDLLLHLALAPFLCAQAARSHTSEPGHTIPVRRSQENLTASNVLPDTKRAAWMLLWPPPRAVLHSRDLVPPSMLSCA